MTRGAARGARDSADGGAEHRALRYGLLRVDRGQGRHEHRNLGERPRGDGAGGHRSDDTARRSRAARPHVSVAGAQRRRARARRSDRSRGRSLAHRRTVSRRRHLRNHERRRHDGAGAGADEVRQAAQAADDHHRRPDSVPDAGPRRWCGASPAAIAADRARRLPGHRVRESHRPRNPRRARQRRDRRTARTCWCACTRAA